MTRILKSTFFHRFAAGFLLGTIGVVALQPAEAGRLVETQFAHAQR